MGLFGWIEEGSAAEDGPSCQEQRSFERYETWRRGCRTQSRIVFVTWNSGDASTEVRGRCRIGAEGVGEYATAARYARWIRPGRLFGIGDERQTGHPGQTLLGRFQGRMGNLSQRILGKGKRTKGGGSSSHQNQHSGNRSSTTDEQPRCHRRRWNFSLHTHRPCLPGNQRPSDQKTVSIFGNDNNQTASQKQRVFARCPFRWYDTWHGGDADKGKITNGPQKEQFEFTTFGGQYG